MFTYIEFIELFMISVLYWKGGKETGGEKERRKEKGERLDQMIFTFLLYHIPALKFNYIFIQQKF